MVPTMVPLTAWPNNMAVQSSRSANVAHRILLEFIRRTPFGGIQTPQEQTEFRMVIPVTSSYEIQAPEKPGNTTLNGGGWLRPAYSMWPRSFMAAATRTIIKPAANTALPARFVPPSAGGPTNACHAYASAAPVH